MLYNALEQWIDDTKIASDSIARNDDRNKVGTRASESRKHVGCREITAQSGPLK